MTNLEPSKVFEEQVRAAVNTPEADPAFVRQLRGRLAHMPVPQPKPRFAFRPAWGWGAVMLLVIVIAASSPGVVGAFRQMFGFIPGIGLVEQGGPSRMLPAPVAVTRDGITLTIDHALAYTDRVEIAYTVSGISGEQREGSGQQVCTGADMYPRLALDNGAQVPAEPMALGGSRSASGYSAGHSFSAAIPAGTGSAAFLLTCLQEVNRGAAPEDWSVPFTLVDVPEGVPVGQPLVTANQPVQEQAPAGQAANREIDFSFEGGALHDDGYHIFFRFASRNAAPDFMTARPLAVYALDSAGARIELINALPWSPFDKVDVWEYRMVTSPAPGPLTLVIEGAQVYYLAQDASFTFTPGEQPRLGQTWRIGEHFEIGGHGLVVQSAEAIELVGHPGFAFVITADEADLKLAAELMDMHAAAEGYETWSTTGNHTAGSRITPGFVYTSDTPETVRVTFNTISVQTEGTWKLEWTPPAE